MLHVSIPNNNLPEREYIIEVMLTGFLGLPYSLTPGPDPTAYHLCFDGAELVIRDHFFSRYPSPLSYLVKEAIPLRAGFLKNRCTIDKDIPVIYGNDEFHHEGQNLVCGIDLFGSSFFMLARWEEAVLRVRDIHNRFPGRRAWPSGEVFSTGLLSTNTPFCYGTCLYSWVTRGNANPAATGWF